MLEQNKQKIEQNLLVCILAFGFLLRLVLAVATEGYVYDINCFFAWGLRMAEAGASGFYAEDYFCDYPPAYLYILGLVGHFMNLFGLHYLDKMAQILLVFVPACADIAMAFGLYHIANKMGNTKIALRLAAFVAFCPMFWYDTAVWKQIDSVLALCMLACFYVLGQKRWILAAAFYGLSLAVKPQALIIGPVFGLCFLLPLVFASNHKTLLLAVKNGVLGVIAALAPLYLCALPFFGVGHTARALYDVYTTTAASYPYATVNAFNFMAACGGNWVQQSDPMQLSIFGVALPLPFSWETFGMAAILASTAFVGYLGARTYRANEQQGRFSPAFLAAVYMISVFTFGHRMHERYLLLGVVLLLCAVAQYGSVRLLSLAGGFSLAMLFNMAAVYTVVDTDDSFLTSASSVLMIHIVSVAETVLCVVLLYEAWQICCGKRQLEVDATATRLKNQNATSCTKKKAEKQANAIYQPAPQLPWVKCEKMFLLLLTLAVTVLSFVYLGDMSAPQNALDVRQSDAAEAVVVEGEAASLWVYPGVTENGATLTLFAPDGEAVLSLDLAIGDLFQWQSYEIPSYPNYIVMINGVQMMELGFKDAEGNLLAVQGVTGALSAMFDEQMLIPEVISQLNSFYFDEIYHARTAYESIHGMEVYEISHPPMGKNFIALGVMLFGMTGFGWRFAGALFGVLMVPVSYWLTRRLTRSRLAAGFVAVLLSFDFMRFTQSRIATIDTISAFFILLAATCMVWYCQSVLEKGVRQSVAPMALSGLAFGFGVASKWTGLYAGAGLAVLYFGVLFARYCQQVQVENQVVYREQAPKDKGQTGKNQENKEGKQAAPEQTIVQTVRGIEAFWQECGIAVLGGVAFFVVLPLMIYLASYLPYRLANPNFGLAEWWQNQNYMYSYHSTLEATHPFASSWYTWFFDLRPVWYYMGGGLAEGTYASIAGFYNPIVCWVGMVAWLRLCLRALQGKGTLVGNALIVLLLSQLLPWLLITRCTFLYHYFPSFLFTVIAIGLWLKDFHRENEGRAYCVALTVFTLAVAFFIWFYPVLSGLPVGEAWAQSLRILPSYGFYII